jgi:Flp pilus assembly protein TadD
MRPILAIAPLAALVLAACATTRPTEQEQAVIDTMNANTIVPASAAERQAIRSQDVLTQAAFWAEAYELNPSDLEASLELSRTLRQLGNHRRAAEVAQQTLALYPDNPQLLLAHGSALAAAGRGVAGLESLRRASELEPGNWRILNALGVAQEQAGQNALARETFRAALDLEPGRPAILSNLALSYATAGEAETAERMLREAMIRPGADATIRQNLALVIALQGRFDEAEQMARVDVSGDMAEANMAYIRAMLTSRRRYDSVRAD